MQERKCSICRGFRYITCYCRNKKEIEKHRRIENGRPKYQPSSNKFEILTSNIGEESR